MGIEVEEDNAWHTSKAKSKWMEERIPKTEVAELKILRTAKDRNLCRSMVTNILKGYDR